MPFKYDWRRDIFAGVSRVRVACFLSVLIFIHL